MVKAPRAAGFDWNAMARQGLAPGAMAVGMRPVLVAPQGPSPGQTGRQNSPESRRARQHRAAPWPDAGHRQAPQMAQTALPAQQVAQTGHTGTTVGTAGPSIAVIEKNNEVAQAYLYPANHLAVDHAAALPTSVPSSQQPPILVYHCKHPHGFFSMFSLVLGHITTCERNGVALYVDWSDSDLLYCGPPGQPNVWQVFFKHPAEVFMSPQIINERLAKQDYEVTEDGNLVYGAFKGVIEGYGGIPPDCAAHGRALCRRWIHLRPDFEAKLREHEYELLGGNLRWLAVHIRRGDKAVEAASNFTLTDEAIISRIVMQCMVWQMDGVFLCSDDCKLKARLEEQLTQYASPTGAALAVSSYDSTLTQNAQCTHMDRSLDGFKKAEDIATEALLMAKCCHGLISTYSNVSASVVYLSPEGYPYTSFFDPIESTIPVQFTQARVCNAMVQSPAWPMLVPQTR